MNDPCPLLVSSAPLGVGGTLLITICDACGREHIARVNRRCAYCVNFLDGDGVEGYGMLFCSWSCLDARSARWI